MISPEDSPPSGAGSQISHMGRGTAIWAVAPAFPAAPPTGATPANGRRRNAQATGAGWSRPRLCLATAAASIAKSTMAMILTGERLQIRKHHADRILAVDRAAIANRALVPGGRTWTLLNELLEAGYTKTFVAKQLGSRAKTVSLQIQADRITALTASKVERLYRRIPEGRVSSR